MMLSYTDQGSGVPLVLLHAFPLSRRMWDEQVASWRSHLRVLAPDYRGFGDSPLSDDSFTIESCADDVRQLIEERGIHEKVWLLGLSMGGYVAFEFVRKYPEVLQGLILVATHPFADTEVTRQARLQMAENVVRDGTGPLADQMIPRLLGKTTRETQPQVVRRVRNLIEVNSPAGLARACYALASRRDSTAVLPGIRVPCLIVAGAEDVIVSSGQIQEMQQQVPNALQAVVEQSGHLVNLEQPKRFEEAVRMVLS